MGKLTLVALLRAMVEQDASDLHITNQSPPQFRIHGKLAKAKTDSLTPESIKELVYEILTESQKKTFEANHELDFSFGVKDVARFRGNLFFQRGSMGAVFRKIPVNIPDFDSLRLPETIKKIVKQPNGLFLVTGPTGSGKSTSLAAIIDFINREDNGHILTVEDPIEFTHPHKNCIVNQREVGTDSLTFHDALKHALRQDPDFILVGELRDLETIEMALTAAETGHMVFATMHTNSTVQTIARVVNVFPPHQQAQIRQLLAATLAGVMTQQLVPNSGRPGRSAAYELMVPTLAIRNLIREDKMHQVYGVMQSGQAGTGMQTMNQALADLVRKGNLTKADAMGYTLLPEELMKMV
ncbi:MAG: type IV pilus twitching motility protein PilT [Bdellovibrionales bacterium]|nr:type IV pilus twitching motility protein PilT [Bdellovibrionales bacterium]